MTQRIIGIDVSKWQGLCDWPAIAAAGVRFAFLKACNGTSRDPQFAANWRLSAGVLPRGAYLWLTDEDPRKQAEAVVALLDTSCDRGEMPIAIDVEETSSRFYGRALVAHVLACADRVEELTGRKPIMYSGAWYLDGRCTADEQEPLVARGLYWHAQYPRIVIADRRACASNPPTLPPMTLPKGWIAAGATEQIVQFDGDGGCLLPSGVDADFNEWMDTPAAFDRFIGRSNRGPVEVPRADSPDPAPIATSVQGSGASR